MTSRLLFSIHTEFQKHLGEEVSKFFDCFSIWEGTGYWKRNQESAARIDILLEDTQVNRIKVQALAGMIRRRYAQEAVYVTSQTVGFQDIREEEQ